MIYELRTYAFKPGTIPQWEERLAALLPVREQFSKLLACWRMEIGPMNQAVHIWPYEDLAHRTKVREGATNHPDWPPHLSDICIGMESEIYLAPPFKPPLPAGEYGPFYELRRYRYQVGSMPTVLERWAESLPAREKLSPVAALLYSEIGPVNTLVHIWPYKDLNERARVRAEAGKLSNWPPRTREFQIKQENCILLPASFSPWR